MKKLISATPILILLVANLSYWGQTSAQTPYPVSNQAYQQQRNEIKTLMGNPKRLITNGNFILKLDSVLNKASGFAYKDGKAGRTSATLEEKAITLNLNLIDHSLFTMQLSLAGARNEKMLDIFTEGKYARTLSAGVKFNLFPPYNYAKFPVDNGKTKQGLNDKLAWLMDYHQKARQSTIYSDLHGELNRLHASHGKYLDPKNLIDPQDLATYTKDMARLGQLLDKFGPYLPKDFRSLDAAGQAAALAALNADQAQMLNNYSYALEMDTLNKLQLATSYKMMFLNWLTLGANFNNDRYPMLDTSASSLTRNYHDNYLTADLAYNMLWKTPNHAIYLFPKLSFSRARDFASEPLKTLYLPQGTQTVHNVPSTAYKTVAYYGQKAPRASSLSAEIPFMIYFPKSKFGLDLALTHQLIPFENFGGRIGVYLPIAAGEQTLTIEPLIKFKNLDDRSKSFKDEQLYFGFNLSISIPDFLTGK